MGIDWKYFFDCPGPGWFLQWGADNAAKRYPGYNIKVVDESGFPLCGIDVFEPKGTVILTADNSKIYKEY